MSRYTGAKLKIIRRLGSLPGLTKKSFKGQSPKSAKKRVQKKITQYGLRLAEKQKLKFNYGLSETQLLNYMELAKKRKGVTGNIFLQLLEMRLDNILFRAGLTPTIAAARQFVNHKNLTVNRLCVSIPSYQCKAGDVLRVKSPLPARKIIKAFSQSSTLLNIPPHICFDKRNLEIKVLTLIERDWVALKINELFVIEFYSRKI